MNPHSDAVLAWIERGVRSAVGDSFTLRHHHFRTRGGAYQTLTISDGRECRFFVKTGNAAAGARFAAEIDGLSALKASGAFRVPEVISLQQDSGRAALVLEYLDLHPIATPEQGRLLASSLIALHRRSGERFGWRQDNYIGLTPQINTEKSDWSRFFVDCRLRPQLELARRNGACSTLLQAGERLLPRVAALFLDYRPAPSLLHGDLWHGNAGITSGGEAAIFDPACYYGDRESDLAMTELFGGFPTAFYAAYRSGWPLNEGFEQRKPLYALYHILNHLNLFGRAYQREAEQLLSRLNRALAGDRG